MTDEEKFMTEYRWKGPMTLARKIENVFSFLYSEPEGNLCHFDKELLDQIKAAALRGCTAVPEGQSIERNCGNCKHIGDEPATIGRWDDKADYYIEIETYFECKRVAHGNDSGRETVPGEHALVLDGSGYSAKLCVEKTFYCKFWESMNSQR